MLSVVKSKSLLLSYKPSKIYVIFNEILKMRKRQSKVYKKLY